MTRVSRLLMLVAALALGAAFLVPLWRIELIAPQYPEGLGMLIRLNAITGIQPQDLTNINELNHYIGMKAIVPDAIPELRIIPVVVGLLAAGALLVAASGRRLVLQLWLGAFGILGAFGLYDFWKWEYDYGHDLDPTAAISIPGMTYQPPLIGAKTLLNFVASSWPAAGALLIGAAFLLGIVALVRGRHAMSRGALAAAAALGVACAPAGPRTIAYDADGCAQCRMTISDARFGAELVSHTGRAYTFDSIECLASYVAEHADTPPKGVWVSDYAHPGTLLPVDSAEFRALAGPAGSPMGKGWAATRRGAHTLAGAPVSWREVVAQATNAHTTRVADAR